MREGKDQQKRISIDRLAYSLDETAKMLGVSIGHLRNENRRGRLAFTKSGRRTLIMAAELRSYLEELTERKERDESNFAETIISCNH